MVMEVYGEAEITQQYGLRTLGVYSIGYWMEYRFVGFCKSGRGARFVRTLRFWVS